MFESYPHIEYDARTRRINRLMKIIGIPIALLIIGGCTAGIVALVDAASKSAVVINDTSGDIICYGRFDSQGGIEVRETGRVLPGERDDIALNSRCAIFTAAGDYVACLAVREDGRQIQASSEGNRSVKARDCVYPR